MFPFARRIAELEEQRIAFAVATVVARHSPVSGHLGDCAIVFGDGRMEGFVGGACSRDIIRRQALNAITSGIPRLVQIRPTAADEKPDLGIREVVVVPMGCASEGSADIFVQPHLPAVQMVVIGFTPVAHSLAQIAAAAGYEVIRVVAACEFADLPGLSGTRDIRIEELESFLSLMAPMERARGAAIVASQGLYDEVALESLLSKKTLGYIGLVASRKRARSVFGVLEQHHIPRSIVETVHNPAGIDIGARGPGDVAISILAELAQLRSAKGVDAVENATVSDPVCGTEVEIETASRAAYNDAMYYFCCEHCRTSFLEEPARFLSVSRSS